MNGKTFWNAKGGKTIQECKTAGRGLAAWRNFMIAGAIVGAFLLVAAMPMLLYAQSYPSKPIRLIVPSSPGGATDILGRIIGQKFAERLGQPVVIENRPGASGNVGAEFAAKARPDGYTIVLVAPWLAISPSLYKKLNYDPIKDLAPISLVAQTPNVLLVKPSLPFKSLKEFVDYAKVNPRKLNFGSGGIGTSPHLACELLKSLTKIDMLHVPYKGGGPALIGLVGGEIDMLVSPTPTAMSQIQAGKVRSLAVLSEQRLPSLPNVPTAKEAGIENYEVSNWYGIFVPAGTPRDIIKRLNAEWINIEVMPNVREQMQNNELDPFSGTPEQFSKFLKAETVRWAKVIKDANIPRID